MGRKRSRAGQFILFCIAGLIFFSLNSCTALEKQCVLTREIYVEKAPKQAEHLKPSVEGLGRAEQLFKQGDYDGSLKENQRVLSIAGKNPPGDKALFNMGLIFAHGNNPKKDYDKSLLFFRKILNDYPQSPWVEEAKIWVRVLQENDKLKKVIEKLIEVDIAVEEKKREKAR